MSRIKITNSVDIKQRLPVKRFSLKLRQLFSTRLVTYQNVTGPEIEKKPNFFDEKGKKESL